MNTATDTAEILVVDDHARARESMADILRHGGHHVRVCGSASEALQKLQDPALDWHPDVILTDLRMPGMNGLEFIRALQQAQVDASIVMVTAHASVSSAVDAMRYGAFDYIEKPFDADQLENLIGRALRHGEQVGRRSTVPDSNNERQPVMIGESPAMRQLQQRLRQVAPTDETVLITGESGTGKEVVAQTLHAQSLRTGHAMVSLNCPALSPQLMESELFGHERGAFTSADAPRVGRFELAHQGTILLDEVTEISLPLQAKLLRVLQERCFERVGSSETQSVDVRVLATTNRELHREVAEGNFREDLFYRLAVVPLHVPPLRQRREDVPLLVDHFLRSAANRLQKEPRRLTSSARDLLLNYHWPGNVRELENLITRASVLSTSAEIDADSLRPWLLEHADGRSSSGGSATGEPSHDGSTTELREIPVGISLQAMERKMIEATLEHFAGHRAKTADALGIGVRTLSNKLRSYGYAPRTKTFAPAQEVA